MYIYTYIYVYVYIYIYIYIYIAKDDYQLSNFCSFVKETGSQNMAFLLFS